MKLITLQFSLSRRLILMTVILLFVACFGLVSVIAADEQPTLIFSTYLGGSSIESGSDIAVDMDGNIYVAGSTYSDEFPITTSIGAPEPDDYDGSGSLFVSKFDPTGTTLLYSTVFGIGEATGLTVDDDGYVYLVGAGTYLPTVNPIQSTNAGLWDAFIVKLNPTGTALEFATFLGGNADDIALELALDAARNIYVVGRTRSADFPTQNAYDNTYGGVGDIFIAKLNPSGSALLYSTYYGGTRFDVGYDMVADGDGNTYLTGYTSSGDFPILNAYQSISPESCLSYCENAFAVKLNPSGMPIFSTYLGGSGTSEEGQAIAIDGQRNIYLTGSTDSTDFPVQNAYQPTLANTPAAFLTKFNPSGSQLVYSTYLGGTDAGSASTGMAVDDQGSVALAGQTAATDFPVVEPIQAQRAGAEPNSDLFISRFSADGQMLLFSTYLGGSDLDGIYGGTPVITLDRDNNLLVVSVTRSNDFPVVNAYQNQQGGTLTNPDTLFEDALFAKIAFSLLSPPDAAAERNYFTTYTPTLTWKPVTWALAYRVQVDRSLSFTAPLDFNAPGSADSVVIDLPTDGFYYWRMQVKKPDGSWTAWKVMDSFTIDAD